MGKSDSVVQDEGLNSCSEYPQVKQDGLLWESMKNKRIKEEKGIILSVRDILVH